MILEKKHGIEFSMQHEMKYKVTPFYKLQSNRYVARIALSSKQSKLSDPFWHKRPAKQRSSIHRDKSQRNNRLITTQLPSYRNKVSWSVRNTATRWLSFH